MDPLRLLSRSTKLAKGAEKRERTTPSSGQNVRPQLFDALRQSSESRAASRKRKRGQDLPTSPDEHSAPSPAVEEGTLDSDLENDEGQGVVSRCSGDRHPTQLASLSPEQRKAVLRQHKIKITWLSARSAQKKAGRNADGKSTERKAAMPQLFPDPLQSFDILKDRFQLSRQLHENIESQGYSTPTEVQLAALPLLLDNPASYLVDSVGAHDERKFAAPEIDLLTVAPTGSGKTLAFMIPLLQKLQQGRRDRLGHSTSAIILAPTKELVGQIVNEGRKMAKGTSVKVTQLRKGMRLPSTSKMEDEETIGDEDIVVKADIIVGTPGLMHSTLQSQEDAGLAFAAGIRSLILDEADVLLDPLFREQTLAVWNALSSPALRVSVWSATMGSNVEELARSTINQRLKRLASDRGNHADEAPLVRLVVGLKDSAVPSVQHKLVYAATEQGKLMGLRQLLHPAPVLKDSAPALRPPLLVFTQTIERAVALHSELRYDIPAEAGGISRIAVLHSDLSDTARDSVMTRFRKGEVWVLITTDLLSRGVDFRGVNGVVNYDIPTSSAAYVHRVGRTGRAGREGGVAVTLYSKEDIPYLKHIANVVAAAQKQKNALGTTSDTGLDQWLLDALPTLSKQDKQKLKKHGVESRTARARDSDPKAARRSKISSKSGYIRRTENNRKGAILGSQNRSRIEKTMDDGDETDFEGFD